MAEAVALHQLADVADDRAEGDPYDDEVEFLPFVRDASYAMRVSGKEVMDQAW
ncbi:hypothetical protein [Streptomyces sp. MZ04]|uniref:hypothetical protein n=1 Tax=Streptomyces sp. MZ04 TaxID=2559236 RepID=UPI00143282B2|nr:hypothetical protein [Streptomyces sp. MZ04]